jgi:tetratricopeptide (TPR) repeat protein
LKSFGELLSEYINRVGVSDAELARRLGVSRQTIFRWRQGHTRRPRYRQDVLEMARKLRLTAAERDALLIAAGFYPQGELESPELIPQVAVGEEEAAHRIGWVRPALAGLILVVILALLAGAWALLAPEPGALMPAAAEEGETLVLVSEFANYGGEQIGYNIAGRLLEALEATFEERDLEGIRIERYPQVVDSNQQAQETLEALGATMLLWGEYDSGRVIVRTSAAGLEASSQPVERRWWVSSPQELNATVNFALAEEVRWTALYVLGRVYVGRGHWDAAKDVFSRARFLGLADGDAQASLDFYLGLVESQRDSPQWDAAIAHYTAAVERRPGFVSALYNRGLAYMQRGSQGDWARAEQDFRAALDLDPAFAPAAISLAVLLASDSPTRLDEALQVLRAAAERARPRWELENALCWYGSLAGDSEAALAHCDKAVAMDTSGYSNDSRGLALALLGRYEEAAQEFERFLARLEAEDPALYARYAPSRQRWIAALKSGQSPFDQELLNSLLRE